MIVRKNKKYIDTFFKKKAIDKMDEERKRAASQHKNRMGASFSRNNSSVS